MRVKWRLLKTAFGILVLAFLVSFSANRHACKPITDIKIKVDHESGKYFVNDSLVRKIIDGKELRVSTQPLGNIVIAEVEKTLDKNSFVRKSQVYQDLDGVMQIQIQQETPVARINTGVNEYYLSEQLTEIPLSNLYASEVLLVGGNIEESDYAGLKELCQFVSADKLLKKHIIAVKKEEPNSFILLVNKVDYVIEFGELENIESKFEKLKLFYDEHLSKVGLNYYKRINLRFNNQIVATKRTNDEK